MFCLKDKELKKTLLYIMNCTARKATVVKTSSTEGKMNDRMSSFWIISMSDINLNQETQGYRVEPEATGRLLCLCTTLPYGDSGIDQSLKLAPVLFLWHWCHQLWCDVQFFFFPEKKKVPEKQNKIHALTTKLSHEYLQNWAVAGKTSYCSTLESV